MGHLGMNLTRNGLIVLISVIFVAGAGTVYAGIVLPTITLAGNVVVTDNLTVDTDTLVVDSTTDRVGIGVTNPTSKLHVIGDLTLESDIICTDCIESTDILDGSITAADFAPGVGGGGLVLDSLPGVASFGASMIIGTDGFPIMSFYSFEPRPQDILVKVMHCTSTDCSTFDVFTLDDTVRDDPNALSRTDIVISGGLPAVIYEVFDIETQGQYTVTFTRCSSIDCSTFDTPRPLLNLGASPMWPAMIIGSDGFPRVTFGFELCCETLLTFSCLDFGCIGISEGVRGLGGVNGMDIATGTDGNSIISYFADGVLKIFHCTEFQCATADPVVTLFTPPHLRQFTQTSIAIGSDGLPVIVAQLFKTPSESNLIFVHCTSVNCSTFDTPIPIDDVGNTGVNPTIVISSDGLPVISYHRTDFDNLKFIHCSAVDCSTIDNARALDVLTSNGRHTTMTIGTDGNPLIVYSNDNIVHCGDPRCMV